MFLTNGYFMHIKMASGFQLNPQSGRFNVGLVYSPEDFWRDFCDYLSKLH